MKRVLVTGGAGFIGSHTVDLLLEKGIEVVVYDNLDTGKLFHLNLFHPNLRFIQEDILHYEKLTAEISRCDAVLHLAAISSVPKSIEDPIKSHRVNTQGFIHILQAIRETKKTIRLVYASSAAIYGNTATLPCCEETSITPAHLSSPYALEKLNNEHYANLYEHLFGLQSLGLRYFNVYGPRQDPASPYSGVISKFIEYQKQGRPLTIFGDGTQSRDFIYVKDVALANILALQSHYTGSLNIATGKPETLLNLAHYLEKATNHPVAIEYTAKRPGDILQSYASTKKAEKHMGFQYSLSLEEGIKQLAKPAMEQQPL